jgi:hypothetical protein
MVHTWQVIAAEAVMERDNGVYNNVAIMSIEQFPMLGQV